MKSYQITLKGGRTDTINLNADTLLDVRGLYESFSSAQIVYIKEVVYINSNPISNDNPAYRELKMLNSNGDYNKFSSLRFLNPNLSKDYIISKIKSLLTLGGKNIIAVKGLVFHR